MNVLQAYLNVYDIQVAPSILAASKILSKIDGHIYNFSQRGDLLLHYKEFEKGNIPLEEFFMFGDITSGKILNLKRYDPYFMVSLLAKIKNNKEKYDKSAIMIDGYAFNFAKQFLPQAMRSLLDYTKKLSIKLIVI